MSKRGITVMPRFRAWETGWMNGQKWGWDLSMITDWNGGSVGRTILKFPKQIIHDVTKYQRSWVPKRELIALALKTRGQQTGQKFQDDQEVSWKASVEWLYL